MKVLIIDDDIAWAKSFSCELIEKGYTTAIALTKDDAINELKNNTYVFITVDMFIGNDEFAGLKVIKEIRALTDAYIIVLSGSNIDPNIVLQCHQHGAIGYELKKYYLEIPEKLKDITNGSYPPMLLTMQFKYQQLNNQDIKVIKELEAGKKISEIDKISVDATYKRIQRIRKKIGIPINILLKYLKLDTFLSNDKTQKN